MRVQAQVKFIGKDGSARCYQVESRGKSAWLMRAGVVVAHSGDVNNGIAWAFDTLARIADDLVQLELTVADSATVFMPDGSWAEKE